MIVEVENTNQLIDVETIYQVIDKNGNVKIESKYAPNYYAEYDIWVIDSKLYDKSLKSITSEKVEVEYLDDGYFMFEDSENNEVGIINYKNNKIFSMPGNVASGHLSKNEFDKDDQYVFIKNYTTEPNKAVVVSLKSKKIVYTIEDFDNCIGSDEENGVFYYYRSGNYDNKTFLYFKDSKLMYETTEPMDDLEVYDYENDILELEYGWNYEEEYGKEKQSYYYDVKNGKLLDEKPSGDTSDDDSDVLDDLDKEMEEIYGFKIFSANYNEGIMVGDKIVLPSEYDSITELNAAVYKYMKSNGKELVILRKDGKTMLYDLKKSEVVANFDSNYLQDYDDSTFIKYSVYDENRTQKATVVYNLLSGKMMEFNADDDIDVNSNYIVQTKGNQKVYYNTKLEKIYSTNN